MNWLQWIMRALTCCANSELSRHADVAIAPLPNLKVIKGFTRMKKKRHRAKDGA